MFLGSGYVIICTVPDLDPDPDSSINKQKILDFVTMISTGLRLLNDMLALKPVVNLRYPYLVSKKKQNKLRKNLFFVGIFEQLSKRAGSGSVIQ
jgi:hypothetical protein